MAYLRLSGDEPVPSTDEESVFVGKDDAEAIPETSEDSEQPAPRVTIPAPGGGGSYPMPLEDDNEPRHP
jgi:hypothetical protein